MQIDKVITSFQDSDSMEEINTILGCFDIFTTDYWAGISDFEDNPKLEQFAEKDELKALKDKSIDYIVFRVN